MEKILPKDLDLDASLERINRFLDIAEKEAIKKERAANNINSKMTLDTMIRCLIESAGQVSAAVGKGRYELAKAECIDLVYCTALLFIKADKLITPEL